MSVLKASLIGATIALVLVAAVVVLVVAGVGPFAKPSTAPSEGPVLVALVLPGADGVMAPKVIDVYAQGGSGWTVRSVEPSAPAVVAGTGGNTVADSYSFGGGDGLASAAGGVLGVKVKDWVIVDASAWQELYRAPSMPVHLPADVSVFDGSQLYSFPASATQVPTSQLTQLLQGVDYLPPSQADEVRAQIGDTLGTALVSADVSASMPIRTDMTIASLRGWLEHVRTARRVTGR